MARKFALLPVLCATILFTHGFAQASPVTISWSPVGDPGNANDCQSGAGAVAYSYEIGTYDVTVNQYVAFLNANDPSGADPLALYTADMGNAAEFGQVVFNAGASAGGKYSAMNGDGNHPINWVSWYDSVRFANWMDNGQPVFSTEPTATNNATESGSYTLIGFQPTPSNQANIVRSPQAKIVIPTDSEWFKAAFYNPNTGRYYFYPTSSNIFPNYTYPTAVPDSANFYDVVGNLTDVGAYSGTTSPYGEYDTCGDVYQWEETASQQWPENALARGGSFDEPDEAFEPGYFGLYPFSEGQYFVGFRLAMVPEPSSIVLGIFGFAGALSLRKRLS